MLGYHNCNQWVEARDAGHSAQDSPLQQRIILSVQNSNSAKTEKPCPKQQTVLFYILTYYTFSF